METSNSIALEFLLFAISSKTIQKTTSGSNDAIPNAVYSIFQHWMKFLVLPVIVLLFLSPIVLSAGVGSISPLLGHYKVTFIGQVGGPYESTGSIVSGTTTGIIPFQLEGNIILSESEPGVISVPEGTTIPGIDPDEIIYGAAVIQNPVQVFIGTEEATRPGDFGLHSMVKFGLPSDPNQLFYSGCYGEGAFSCIPMFFRRHTYSGESVNLVYFTIDVNGNADSVIINGILYDRHISEASAANLFSVPVESPILGVFNDVFLFNVLSNFEIIIQQNKIRGRIKGAGYSVAGLEPQEAILEVEFEGAKENTTGNRNHIVDEFFVFPNPTEGHFQIIGYSSSSFESFKVEVYSILGRKILAFDLNSFPCEIDLSDEKKGIYFMRIFNKEKDIWKKIVVR